LLQPRLALDREAHTHDDSSRLGESVPESSIEPQHYEQLPVGHRYWYGYPRNMLGSGN
jgi:hypothetical protein